MKIGAVLLFLFIVLTSEAFADEPPLLAPSHRHNDHHVTTVCVQVRGHPSAPVCGPMVDPPSSLDQKTTTVEEARRSESIASSGPPTDSLFLRQLTSQRGQMSRMSPEFVEAVPVYNVHSPPSFRVAEDLNRPRFSVNSQQASVMFRANEPLHPAPPLLQQRADCNEPAHHMPLPPPINPAPRFVAVGIPPPLRPPILIENGPPMAVFPPLTIATRGAQMRQGQQQFSSQTQQFSNQGQPKQVNFNKEACLDDFQLQQQKMRAFVPGSFPPQVSGMAMVRESETKGYLEKQCEEQERMIQQQKQEIDKLQLSLNQMNENKATVGSSTTKNYERKEITVKNANGNGKTEISSATGISSSTGLNFDKRKRGTPDQNSEDKTVSS